MTMNGDEGKGNCLSEESIATIAEKYLHSKGWATYPEVVIPIFGGRPDFIATKGNLCLVAEIKQSLSFPVIEQLVRWHLDYKEAKESTYRNSDILGIPHLMVAVVFGRQNLRGLKLDILKRYRIGVVSIHDKYAPKPLGSSMADIEYNGMKWSVIEEIAPQIQPGSRASAQNIIMHLNHDMRCGKAGASGRVGGFMTPFKRTMGHTWLYLNSQETGKEIHISAIVGFLNSTVGHHYTTDKGAQKGIIDALARDGISVNLYRIEVPCPKVISEMQRKYPIVNQN